MSKNRKILGAFWSAGSGIVAVETERYGIKYYMMSINPYTTPEKDAEKIADWGGSFPKNIGDQMMEEGYFSSL